ncbi:MAG: hypothetical protein GY913_16995 [Proteobacteria bacterium]|nr:hypothetical protein [Pseudomonadota bacterium]MCP4918602.1 hypothetical protein [Pseudomonadota bacterium]
MRLSRVVARYRDGHMVKGVTTDFDRLNQAFHVEVDESVDVPERVEVKYLKALFFVRDLAGDRYYDETKGFRPPAPDRYPVTVQFHDGEEICGTTEERERTGEGFFLVPNDPNSNNRKVFVIWGAVRRLYFH